MSRSGQPRREAGAAAPVAGSGQPRTENGPRPLSRQSTTARASSTAPRPPAAGREPARGAALVVLGGGTGAEVALPVAGLGGFGAQTGGAERGAGLDGRGGVDDAVPAGVVPAGRRGAAGRVREELLDLGGREPRVRGADQGDGAGDERGGGGGAPLHVVLLVGCGDDDVDPGCADGGVPAAGGERGVGAVPVDGGDRDHAGVGGGVRDVVALLAAVARGGDDDGPLLQRVLDGGVLAGLGVRGLAVVAEREVDDVGAVVGGPADAVGEGRAA